MLHLVPTLAEVSLSVTQEAITRYAAVTGDYNPIHVDPVFAAGTEMGGVIAHGTLSLNLIWQSLEASIGRDRLPGAELDIRFRRPVRVDDLISAGGILEEEGGAYQVWVRNQDDVVVIEGRVALTAR